MNGGVSAAVAADATLVARFYERLGDHAVHIAARVGHAVR
jgi:phosphate uptake regulator